MVLRGQAFACEALSHIGFTGATAAALLGISSLEGMFFFTLLAALGMGLLGKRLRNRDMEVGMILTFMLGLGVLFLNIITQNATTAVNILFGSILSVTQTDVLVTIGAGLFTILLLGGLYRPLLFASFDPDIAEARGVPAQGLSVCIYALAGDQRVRSDEGGRRVAGVCAAGCPGGGSRAPDAPATSGHRAVRFDQPGFHPGRIGAGLRGTLAGQFLYRQPDIPFLFCLVGHCGPYSSPRRYKEPSHPSREVFP